MSWVMSWVMSRAVLQPQPGGFSSYNCPALQKFLQTGISIAPVEVKRGLWVHRLLLWCLATVLLGDTVLVPSSAHRVTT